MMAPVVSVISISSESFCISVKFIPAMGHSQAYMTKLKHYSFNFANSRYRGDIICYQLCRNIATA